MLIPTRPGNRGCPGAGREGPRFLSVELNTCKAEILQKRHAHSHRLHRRNQSKQDETTSITSCPQRSSCGEHLCGCSRFACSLSTAANWGLRTGKYDVVEGLCRCELVRKHTYGVNYFDSCCPNGFSKHVSAWHENNSTRWKVVELYVKQGLPFGYTSIITTVTQKRHTLAHYAIATISSTTASYTRCCAVHVCTCHTIIPGADLKRRFPGGIECAHGSSGV